MDSGHLLRDSKWIHALLTVIKCIIPMVKCYLECLSPGPRSTRVSLTNLLLLGGSCLLGRLMDWLGWTFMEARGEERAKCSGAGGFLGIFLTSRLTHFCCSSCDTASSSRFLAVDTS